ncbi:MAG: oxaloacetate decarboxylase [Alphaproteobacteria bacterium]|nr:oxaloacetate decarboxylase [Alphaproteobacteria bacterium]
MTTKRSIADIWAARAGTIVPGAPNALFARIIEDLGYEAVYVTGAGIANMHLGAPDIGLTTVTEVANIVACIADAVSIPLIVDADTGFGNRLNCYRTVRLLERAGASALQLEDQVFPKKCGHFAGKAVIPASDMVDKLKAALDARVDANMKIIARTDARAITSMNEALDRAEAYIEAGADATFVEAPTSLEELALIPQRLQAPQIANMVFGGLTPEPGQKAMAEMNYAMVLYANAALQTAIKAVTESLTSLRDTGSLAAASEQLAGFEQRQAVVRKDSWDALEKG